MVVNPESVFSGGYFKVGRLTLYPRAVATRPIPGEEKLLTTSRHRLK